MFNETRFRTLYLTLTNSIPSWGIKLHDTAVKFNINPIYQGQLINSKQMVAVEMMMFHMKIEFEEQIAKIISRLDVLEGIKK